MQDETGAFATVRFWLFVLGFCGVARRISGDYSTQLVLGGVYITNSIAMADSNGLGRGERQMYASRGDGAACMPYMTSGLFSAGVGNAGL